MQRIYWHRELPPLADELMGSHTVEATSDPIEYKLSERDAMWKLLIGRLSYSLYRHPRRES